MFFIETIQESIDKLGQIAHLPSDQLRYLFMFFVQQIFCYLFRYIPNKPTLKHIINITLGWYFMILVIGYETVWSIIPGILSYYFMKKYRTQKAAMIVFVLNMILMVVIQIRKYFLFYLQWHLDFATLQMTQMIRIGYFAFNVAKGNDTSKMKNTEYNRKFHILPEHFPNLLEYLGYYYFFPAIFSGPAIEFQTYRKFISFELFDDYKENGIELKGKKKYPPVPWKHYFFILFQGAALLGVSALLLLTPIKKNFYEIVVNNGKEYNIMNKMLWVFIYIYTMLPKYFATWKMSEAMSIIMGYGYSGMKNGKAEYDGAVNIRWWGFFMSNSSKIVVDSWNCNVQSFMRNHIYEGLESCGGFLNEWKLMITNLTSALWHGIYPGYYLSFGMLFLHHDVSKQLYSRVEPFLKSKYGETSVQWKVYMFLTWLYARCAATYSFIPFFLNTFTDSWKFFVNTYFLLDVIGIVIDIVARLMFPKVNRKKD